MNKQKAVTVSAVCGFVLSFLSGLLSRISMGTILVRAFIFAGVFAVVSLLVLYLYDHFLFAGDENDSLSQTTGKETSTPKTGTIVDITVGDTEIPQEEDGPQFFVGNNRSMLTPDDTKTVSRKPDRESGTAGRNDPLKNHAALENAPPGIEAEPLKSLADDEAIDVTTGFVPVQLGEQVTAESAETMVTEDKSSGSATDKSEFSETEEELDELPDIGDIIADNDEPVSEGVINDSEFASEKKAGSAPTETTDQTDSNKDSAVMAQAIRTMLAEDKK
ncbi:MAG: hypothetical protein LKF96_00160 [Treponema sp.]|jgi:hypothetical protein|nr:hypothetical protein [Treponema sp.]